MSLQKVNRETFPQLYEVPLYERILSLLGTGREAGLHISDICRATELENREARRCIETIRRAGVSICTNGRDGYFFPETMEELRLYVRQEERRGRSTFYTMKAARALYKELSEVSEYGEETLFPVLS